MDMHLPKVLEVSNDTCKSAFQMMEVIWWGFAKGSSNIFNHLKSSTVKSQRPRSRDFTVDGVSGLRNSNLANQAHGLQANNKEKSVAGIPGRQEGLKQAWKKTLMQLKVQKLLKIRWIMHRVTTNLLENQGDDPSFNIRRPFATGFFPENLQHWSIFRCELVRLCNPQYAASNQQVSVGLCGSNILPNLHKPSSSSTCEFGSSIEGAKKSCCSIATVQKQPGNIAFAIARVAMIAGCRRRSSPALLDQPAPFRCEHILSTYPAQPRWLVQFGFDKRT